MDQNTRAVRLAQWAAIVQQCQARPENQTISQWLDERGKFETKVQRDANKFRYTNKTI